MAIGYNEKKSYINNEWNFMGIRYRKNAKKNPVLITNGILWEWDIAKMHKKSNINNEWNFMGIRYNEKTNKNP